VRALAENRALARVESLSLECSSAGVAMLAEATAMPRLRTLVLWPVDDAGAAALAGSSTLAGLSRLHVIPRGMSEAAAAPLRQRFGYRLRMSLR
jgi:hypothetical protein